MKKSLNVQRRNGRALLRNFTEIFENKLQFVQKIHEKFALCL
jgi:hypothetical protein